MLWLRSMLTLLGILVVSALAGCGPVPGMTPANTATPAVQDKNGMSGTPIATSGAGDALQVTQAKQDLAKRLSVNPNDIELVSFQPMTWPDSSLGCPQPGMLYTQALVEGYLIRLRVSGRVYEYHGSRTGEPLLCEK